MADQTKTDAEKAAAAAHDAEVKAQEARDKATSDEKSATEKKVAKAEQDADDARAKAAEAEGAEAGDGPLATVETAKIANVADKSLSAGDHLAQKFGNDPANPQPLPGLDGEPNVRLTRITPDVPGGPVEIMVHEVMVGDYLRAGWSR